MTETDVSIIVPVYNAERFLAEAIDSVLAQTLPAREIIVVDDGSMDGSSRIAKGYGDRIVYVYQDNADVAAARNHGIRVARGQYIGFLDADDCFLPDKLKRQMDCFSANPKLDMCITGAANFWSPEVPEARRKGKMLGSTDSHGQASTWVVRRGLFETVGLFEQDPRFRFTEGSEWFLRAGDHGAVIEVLPEVLTKRRLHDNNKTRIGRDQHLESIMMLCKHRAEQRAVQK
jgi:glycosyltransferase involved in cell wall biosynthesis